MVQTTDQGMRGYLDRLKDLGDLEVVAGHLGATARELHPRGQGVTTKGQVAKFVQHGTPRMKARPFMDLASANLQSSGSFQALVQQALAPKKNMLNGVIPIGMESAEAIREAIVALDAVDTGTTRDSVEYEIRTSGGRVLAQGTTTNSNDNSALAAWRA